MGNKRDYMDICDGEYYQSIFRKNKLHLVVYADGTPVRKATLKKQFWPVVVGVVEFPLAPRDSMRSHF